MKSPEPLYKIEAIPQGLKLTEGQKDSVRNITLGIEEVATEEMRSLAVEDVIETLENGHPLNRLIESDGHVDGYIACEDFVPHQAYIKYVATNKATGKNLLQEIPAFLEYAKSKGYTKLNFHGWNNRLNKILTRYGFTQVQTVNMGGHHVDEYEKVLVEEKSREEVKQAEVVAFQKKYLQKVTQDYERILATFKGEAIETKKNAINATFCVLDSRLMTTVFSDEDFVYGELQKAILKLKLARHFQNSENIDTNVLYDAIIESPNFLNKDKGSLQRLLEVHEEKTLQKIAEMRKRRAEMANETFNPYEALFTTKSGNYYMARLLNMPHLEEESQYMNHCVGTSDSYVNKIKRGEVEILSFRRVPKMNRDTGKFEVDTPIMTIEYNLKTKTIQQMKKYDDAYLTQADEYCEDVIDALKQLRTTQTDTGELRDFVRISESELWGIQVQDRHILTDRGEIPLDEYAISNDVFVLKIGECEITNQTPKGEIAKLLFLKEGITVDPNQIATNIQEISSETKAYIGPWSVDVHQVLPTGCEHVYKQILENKVFRRTVELSTRTNDEYLKALATQGMQIADWTKDNMLLTLTPLKKKESVDLVSFSVADLGFSNGVTLAQICATADELGLDLCDPHVGPEMRLAFKDQPVSSDYRIAMKPLFSADGSELVWILDREDAELWLGHDKGLPNSPWSTGVVFVFASRKT